MSNVAQRPKFSVAITTDVYKKLINNTLQDPQRVQRFTSAITSAVAVNPQLQECTPASILSGALLGESLNLSPSPQLGQYYLVPFDCQLKGANGKKLWVTDAQGKPVKDENGRWIPVSEKRAQFVLGYKGYIQLAIRSGQYRDIDAMEIREGEYLGRDAMTGQPKFRFIEDDDEREERPIVGYMAYFEYLNGFRKSVYWTKDKMIAHADQHSSAFSAENYKKWIADEVPENERWKYSSYWYKDFDGMGKKTMIRQLISKWGIMSIEMQQGFVSDSGMIQVQDGNFVTIPAAEEEKLQDTAPAGQAENQEEQRQAPPVKPGIPVSMNDL